MYDYVSPERVMNDLRWLKANNPLYADVNINDNWCEESLANDADLFAGLVKQPDTSSETEVSPQEQVQTHNVNVISQPTGTNMLIVDNKDLYGSLKQHW